MVLFYKFEVFSHCYAVFLDNVSSQLVVVRRFFLRSVVFFFGRPGAMKNGLNWGNGFVIGDANTKIVP